MLICFCYFGGAHIIHTFFLIVAQRKKLLTTYLNVIEYIVPDSVRHLKNYAKAAKFELPQSYGSSAYDHRVLALRIEVSLPTNIFLF